MSVVVPAHDEAANLRRLLGELHAAFDPLGLAWELVLVDDGSTDETPALAADLAAHDGRLHVVRLERRSGQTAALVAGFSAARAPLIATLDADLQCSPADLPRLLEVLGEADLACGIRLRRADPACRRLASAAANAARRLFLAPGIRDLACPLRVFRSAALAKVTAITPLFDGAHRWLPALFWLAGLRVVQVPVPHYPRAAGKSKYTTRGRLLPIARELVTVLGLVLRQSSRLRRAALVALLGLVAVTFSYRLGDWPLMDPDEGRNAEVAREMIALGNWTVPHFNSLPYLDKPVLLFWSVAGAFRALGIGEFAARLPAAVAGTVTVALTFALARMLLGERRAILAAAVAATTPLVIVFSRLVIFDMLLTAFTTAAIYCLVRARIRGGPETWIPLAGLAMGAATLTKGPVGIAVPLLVWGAGRGALGPAVCPTKRRYVLAAMALWAVTVLPWVAAVSRQEPSFLRYALLDETLLRFTSAARFHRGGPAYYYAGVLAWGLGPWSVALVALAPALLHCWRRGAQESRAVGFAARGTIALFIFFSICASKRPAYILPAVVLVALLVAAAVDAEPHRAERVVRAGAVVAVLAGLALLGAGLGRLAPEGRNLRALSPAMLRAGGLFMVTWGVAAAWLGRGRPRVAVACCVLLAPALGAVLLGPLTPYAEGRSARALAAHIDPGARVICYKTFRPGLPFYLRRPVTLASARGRELTSNYVVANRDSLADHRWLVPPAAALALIDSGGRVDAVANHYNAPRLVRLSRRVLRTVYRDRDSVLLRAGGSGRVRHIWARRT